MHVGNNLGSCGSPGTVKRKSNYYKHMGAGIF